MNKFKILSPYPYLAIVDKKEVFIEQGQSLELDSPEILTVYPASNSKTRPAFLLNLESSEDNSFYSVYGDQGQKIFCLSDGLFSENFTIASVEVNGNKCIFEIGENKINMTYLQYKKSLFLQKAFDKYQVGSLSNFAYILLTNKASQELILFDTTQGTLKILSGEQISITSSHILVSKNLDNIARHIVEEEYLVSQEGLIKKSQSLQYQNGRPVVVTAPQTVPYAFLEALQVEDLELASSYLDLSMKRQVDSQHLKEYFGEILSFSCIDTETYLVLSKTGKAIYKFTLNENRISEIESK